MLNLGVLPSLPPSHPQVESVMTTTKDTCTRQRLKSPPVGPTGAGSLIHAHSPQLYHGPQPPPSPRPPSLSITPGRSPAVKWKMALYARQPFPDNHVPDSFLDKLVTNAGISRPELRYIFLRATAVTQQISVVVVFLMAFLYSSENILPLPLLLATDAGLLLGGYLLAACIHPRRMLQLRTLLSTCGWITLCAACLRVIAPVLRTLTVSYSDDTIYALALVLSGLHLVFHDYGAAWSLSSSLFCSSSFSSPASFMVRATKVAAGIEGNENDDEDEDKDISDVSQSSCQAKTATAEAAAVAILLTSPSQFHGTFSLNAALFAAVLLASRLESNEQVFGFVFLAIELFAFFPLARHLAHRRSTTLHLLVALGLVVAATSALAAAVEHRPLLVMYLIVVVFVSLVCPVWLQHIHQYKFTIQGPWDIASVEGTGGEDS